MPERVYLLIDGSNFYHRLKELELKRLIEFDYGKFADFLKEDSAVMHCTYYIGAIREEPGNRHNNKLMANQVRLFNKLILHDWHLSVGDMLKADGRYFEKGVDVRMAVDLVAGAYENLYDRAIVVSSDSDLIPALQRIRSLGKKVAYVGFNHKPSHAMIAHSDFRKLLQKEDLEQFLPPQP